MTLIAIQDGKVVMRDGQIGTGAECCCGCGRCMKDGEWLCEHTTREECEACVTPKLCFNPITDQVTEVANCEECYALEPRICTNNETGGTKEVEDCSECQSVLPVPRDPPTLTATVLGGDRSEPTLTASATQGSGASLDISYEVSGSWPYSWAVSSISVNDGGSGYRNESAVTLSLGEDDVQQSQAVAAIATTTGEPTLTASAAGGTGAEFSIGYKESLLFPGWYSVSSVSVTSGGSGYQYGQAVTFSTGSGDFLKPPYLPAAATARTGRLTPTAWSVTDLTDAGAGAELSFTTAEFTSGGLKWFRLDSASIAGGGSGYAVDDYFEVDAADGVTSLSAAIVVTSVSGAGAVQGVAIDDGGRFFKDDGVIESVEVNNGGVYQSDDGVVASVAVSSGGAYYKQGSSIASLTPITYTPIGTTPETWSIAGIAVADGGSGYADGAPVTLTLGTDDVQVTAAAATVSVNESGEVTAVVVQGGGAYYKSLWGDVTCAPQTTCYDGPGEGVCGTWEPAPCEEIASQKCCESCLPECEVSLNVNEDTANYFKSSFAPAQPNYAVAGNPPWVEGWLASTGPCTLVWAEDVVSQKPPTGKFCANHPVTGQPTYATRNWVRYRLFLVDCRTRTLRDVSSEAFAVEYGYANCLVPSFQNITLCAPPQCNDGPNPGFLNANPTLVCP